MAALFMIVLRLEEPKYPSVRKTTNKLSDGHSLACYSEKKEKGGSRKNHTG